MRNGGAVPPRDVAAADDAALTAGSEQVLARIAQALGVPLDAFRGMVGAPNGKAGGDRPATEEECRELLEAFRRIANPHVRRRCIAILAAFATS